MSTPAAPSSADPVSQGSGAVAALVDDVVAQLASHLRTSGATTAAGLLDSAPITVNTRGWLEGLFATTHPDRVSLPRVRLDEVADDWYPLGVTADDTRVEVRFTPSGERVRVDIRFNGDMSNVFPLTVDAEGGRVTFLAALAMAMHVHPALAGTGQETDAGEVSP